MIAFYGRTLKFVLRYQTATLFVALGTLLLTIFLYNYIPKGFFPVQDTGVIQGISQAPQTIGSVGMAAKQQELAKVILQDPRWRVSRRSSVQMGRTRPPTAGACRST